MSKKYDKRHGGPYDRGSADSYYRRSGCPHYYETGTMISPKVEADHMTKEEIEAYYAGFDDNEKAMDFKEWD